MTTDWLKNIEEGNQQNQYPRGSKTMNIIRPKNPGEGDNVIIPSMTSALFRPTADPILLSRFLVIQCFERGTKQSSLLHPISTSILFLFSKLKFNKKFEVLKGEWTIRKKGRVRYVIAIRTFRNSF